MRYTLVGSIRDRVIYSEDRQLLGESSQIKIPRDTFSTGIVRFTLLNRAGLPLCERIVFNNLQDQLQLTLDTDQTTYSPREEVTIDLSVQDANGNGIVAPFSMSVTHVDGINNVHPDRNNILSHLWLTSDLSGFVEDAPSYFEKDSAIGDLLDLVMLTHGWRTFEWQALLEGDPKFQYPVERGLTLTGQALLPNGKP